MSRSKRHNDKRDTTKGGSSGKWIFRLLSGISFGVIYYLIFSLFFDTPIEREIKQSSEKLEAQFKILEVRYDSIQSVLNNVIERDKGIHEFLFEAQPSQWDNDVVRGDKLRADNRARLSQSNTELGEQLISRTGILYQRTANVRSQLGALIEYVDSNKDQINRIPAIQPIANPDMKLLTTSFGMRIHPFNKTMKQHNGIDYAVPMGTAVFATADGKVTAIDLHGRSTGISITIDHSKEYRTIYANLDKALVDTNQVVTRGEIIALTGDSGYSFAPHLHYEVQRNKTPVDPLDYFFLEIDIFGLERLRKIAAAGMQSFD